MAKECHDLRELRDKVARHYGRRVVQFSLSLPNPETQDGRLVNLSRSENERGRSTGAVLPVCLP
jgi:hypothetical protein